MNEKERAKKQIGNNVRFYRERLGFSQKELAKKAKIEHFQKISKIEVGDQSIKADELILIAKALFVTLDDLLSLKKEFSDYVLWRNEPNSLEEKIKIENEFLELCENYSLAEKWAGIKTENFFDKIPYNDSKIWSFEEATLLAQRVLKIYNLGETPSNSIQNFLEDKLDIKIFYKYNFCGSALSTVGKNGAAILVNSSEVQHRLSFSLAHEFYHILTWDYFEDKLPELDKKEKERVETLANIFASELLLPSEKVLNYFHKHIDVDSENIYFDLAEMARYFLVSTQTLIYKLHNLKLIENYNDFINKYNHEYRFLRNYICHFTYTPENVISEKFVRLLKTAYNNGKVSIGRVAEILNKDIVDVEDIFAAKIFDDEEWNLETPDYYT